MTFNRPPVSIRKITPRGEAHNVGTIGEENGGALTAERTHDRIQCKIIELPHRTDVLKLPGKFGQYRLLIPPARQRLLGAFAACDVVLNAHRVKKPARGIADAR